MACVILAMGLAVCAPARAQEARDYLPTEFARFAPRNALQMLEQVPGFSIRENNADRGLGQATANVLVNGQRVSTKNGIYSELERYTAQAVVRIEIRDAAAYDVAGLSGVVANMVIETSRVSGQFSWEPEFRDHVTRPSLRRGNVSINGALGPVEYAFSAANNAFTGGAGGPTYIYDGARNLTETREERWSNNVDQPTINGKLSVRDWNGITANAALQWRKSMGVYYERGSRTGSGLADRNRVVDNGNDEDSLDLSADVEFEAGPGTLKLIGLNRTGDSLNSQQVVTRFADLSPDEGGSSMVTSGTLERVLRAEYRFKLWGDWQVSAENAFNSLNSAARLFTLTFTGLNEIPLINGSGDVQEDRYDFALAYSAPLLDDLALRVTLGAEQSVMQQVGAGGKTREFFRPKGQLLLTWQANKDTSIAAKLERKVGQLGFGDFLASVDLNNNTSNAGNPELVPPQTWVFDVETTHDMRAWGNMTLRTYIQSIEDIIDIIPIGPTGESIGNLDRALVYGVEWRSTLNFDPLGWIGAKLNSTLQVQKSEVDDPLTGLLRPISDDLHYTADLGLRWDIPDSDWALGGGGNYYEIYYGVRLTEVGRSWEGPLWANFFVENKNVFGLVARFSLNNAFNADSTWNRTVYAGRRTDPVSFIEYRNRPIGHIFSFSISGTF